MSDTVHIYDIYHNQYWRAPGQGHTPNIEEAHPWPRGIAESIVGAGDQFEVREIGPEDIVI